MKNHKWIVTHSVSYEVEAPSADEALAKFEREGASNFVRTGQENTSEDWWDEEKKDTLMRIVGEALVNKAGLAKGYDDYGKFWIEYKKILDSVEGWKTKDVLVKYLHEEHPENSNDSVVSVMMMRFDPDSETSMKTKGEFEERVFYVDIPKDDALKILTLGGVPF